MKIRSGSGGPLRSVTVYVCLSAVADLSVVCSVPETGEGPGEGETETGRDSQLRRQGKKSLFPLHRRDKSHFKNRNRADRGD